MPESTANQAPAASSGKNATEKFRSSGKIIGIPDRSDLERVNLLARSVIDAVIEVVHTEKVTYDEYNALKAWLIRVGDDGEWPLFLDVWIEHAVEEVANAHREGSKGTIEGPYYVPDAPMQTSPATIEMRDDEAGTPLIFRGDLTSVSGTPITDGVIELWHADSLGFYSQFAPGIPEWNLRGTFQVDAIGHYEIRTMQPAPYQIPTDGACGQLVKTAGWSPWRPAHLHFKVSAPGHELLTSQLYFDGGEYVDHDVAQAVKPELLLRPNPRSDGEGVEVTYDFVLDPV